ncbi:aryl-sulfate sulfotransferase, partial [Salmonella enterica subsp. enterica serovar Kentucky]|nr:aryl-sulfate sulfotransferase [Salmonella enterica subsp. enterica serovar Kentucky]
YFLRVASSNYKRPDGKNVRTVRDVIAEVDQNGVVVDEWRLFDKTIETSPTDTTAEKVALLNAFSVNRVSIGVQSFHDSELHTL